MNNSFKWTWEEKITDLLFTTLITVSCTIWLEYIEYILIGLLSLLVLRQNRILYYYHKINQKAGKKE